MRMQAGEAMNAKQEFKVLALLSYLAFICNSNYT